MFTHITQAEWEEVIASMAVTVSGTASPLPLAQAGSVRALFAKVAEYARPPPVPQSAPTAASLPATTAVALASSVPTTGARLPVLLSQVLDHAVSGSAHPLKQDEHITCLERYHRVFGDGQDPPAAVHPSKDQLACRQEVMSGPEPRFPYADYAIFGLFTTRCTKAVKLRGCRFGPGGELIPLEMTGPCDLAT